VIVDISQPLRPGEEIVCEIPEEIPVYQGFPCEEYRFSLRSHEGCYFETSAHLFRGATMTCDVPVERLLLPAVIARLDPDGEGAIEVGEIEHGLASESIRPGDALIVDAKGRDDRYFARACGAWMAEKQVSLLSATLPRFDTGFINPTGLFVELFRAEIPILAGIRNTDRISRQRVFLIVLPLLIERVCTVPCRAVVLTGPPEEIECLSRILRPDLRSR